MHYQAPRRAKVGEMLAAGVQSESLPLSGKLPWLPPLSLSNVAPMTTPCLFGGRVAPASDRPG